MVKGNAIVPTYVLEYLLGQYCATDDEATIEQGIQTVKNVISNHFVHRDQSQIIKSTIREKGSHRIIDKVSLRLNDRKDQYEANFANLGLKEVPVADEVATTYPKLLTEGVWCILTMGYLRTDEKNSTPWVVESIKPIQISNVDVEEYKEVRQHFSKEEWIDLLIQTMGLNPDEFSFRSKLLQLTRLVPFVENNYNLIELGPKGTGKSHVFSELSPHGILLSGGEVTKAKLFVNNSSGAIGLVGYWDVISYDEFAGKTKKTDRGLVDILKNYMANKSFSRGTSVYGASASMVFVGNTDHTVQYMLKHSNLFDALPKDYYDTAFLDRMHAYLPGWEVQKLRNDMFTADYGFIVDYLAEILKDLRREDYTNEYKRFFDLSSTITTRDKDSISKTFAGLFKVIYPNGVVTKDEAKELLEFAIESRKRVKLQLQKMDETFLADKVEFSYTDRETGKSHRVETLEETQYGESDITSSVVAEGSDTLVGTQEVESPTTLAESSQPKQIRKVLKEGQIILRDNQTGISYDKLFGDYLEGSTEITITDPYIRLPYQFKNLMEFIELATKKVNLENEVKIHLVTVNSEEYIEGFKDKLDQLDYALESMGIDFSFEFNDSIHDRSLIMDTGWKVVLGRGLDIWQKTTGWYDLSEFIQEKRLCKACELTYLKV